MQRPKITQEIIEQAAKDLAAEMGWDEAQAAEIANVYRLHMDGYQLAKGLESVHLWDITVVEVDALDSMDSTVREIHRKVCMGWARENDIQPPLTIGTMTTRGEITGIYEHDAACYLVREHEETSVSRRLIVRFEDAKPLEYGVPA